ncbi:scarecrow-like protein 14 [Gastrolobium bilobum]|uniref:scarecrow-like protein 14 n=1 Tax=Gastrolobium bilobum TaxID=150636 RepID=UPI002AB12287|nr:scarecrow-like protein 14 [Gastrolobium bilobum]XP_061368444.1 scarecrow-like protein 14 [Gastrolobium bilobum]
MDPNLQGSIDFINSYQFGEDSNTIVWDQNQYETDWDVNGILLDQPYADSLGFSLHTNPVEGEGASADPSLEDNDFSETVKFISQVLMEENVEQRPFYDPLSLQVTEKSFYDALTENIPLSPNQHPLDILSHDGGATSSSSNSGGGASNSLDDNSRELKPPSPDTPLSVSCDHAFQFDSHAISQHLSTSVTVSDGLLDLDYSTTKMLAQNIFSDADSVSQYRRGLEEASKFLPPGPQLVTGLESKGESFSVVGVNSVALKGRTNHEREGGDTREEGRSSKQSAVGVVDESDLSDMFDQVLLSVEKPLCNEHGCLQNGTVTADKAGENSPSSNGGKARPKKQGKKKETVDLRSLLLLCAQAVYVNDNRTANELLKQIRQHSSPFGDASQRLAHYFANGLETRLLGDATGSQGLFNSLTFRRITAAEFLKAYQVFISVCPFKRCAYFFANKMIMKAAEKAETLHIIDFGIQYGFQWPFLIKFLSDRDGGPPKLKITGIEWPQPGFRPTERNEQTGCRLANYCKRFNVPFEYNVIASRNWETIQVQDFKIESNELVAVNCMMRFENLMDETFEVNSPRNAVLQLIRKINPDVFVQCIVNGSYNAPFFATRFREALFHFSAMFDMCDCVISRDNEKRMMLERELLGRHALNAIACEGFQRIERPETYKQWEVRNTRAGFKHLPLNEELMAKLRTKFKEWYHRDFVFDVDNNWMLQGWKGRILYASTCWVPV